MAGELPEGLPRGRAREPLGAGRATACRDMGRPGTDGAGDAPWPADDERLAALIDRAHVDHPAHGARKIAHLLRESGEPRATRWRVTRPTGPMGVRPCRPLPSPSAPSKASRRFPYLPRDKAVRFPDQVWSTGITYARTGGRHTCLTAVIDWHGRHIVSWRLSDTMRAREVVACARGAFASHGTPGVMNTPAIFSRPRGERQASRRSRGGRGPRRGAERPVGGATRRARTSGQMP